MYLMDGPLDYYGPIFTFYKGGSQFKPFCGHSKFWSIINLEHDTFAVWNLARSWTILTKKILKIYLIIALKYFNKICLKPFLTGQRKVFRTACITWLIDILCFVQFLTLYYVKPKSASEKRRWLLASYFRYWSYSNKSCREITRKQLHWYHRKTN